MVGSSHNVLRKVATPELEIKKTVLHCHLVTAGKNELATASDLHLLSNVSCILKTVSIRQNIANKPNIMSRNRFPT